MSDEARRGRDEGALRDLRQDVRPRCCARGEVDTAEPAPSGGRDGAFGDGPGFERLLYRRGCGPDGKRARENGRPEVSLQGSRNVSRCERSAAPGKNGSAAPVPSRETHRPPAWYRATARRNGGRHRGWLRGLKGCADIFADGRMGGGGACWAADRRAGDAPGHGGGYRREAGRDARGGAPFGRTVAAVLRRGGTQRRLQVEEIWPAAFNGLNAAGRFTVVAAGYGAASFGGAS